MRRVPLDRRAQELRRGERPLRHHLGEISVGCEACHGQGSRHVAWARAQRSWWPFGKSDDPRKGLLARFDERRASPGRSIPKTGNAARSVTPATLRKEVETCGRCHARRGEISEDWVPGRWLSDTHVGVAAVARALLRRRADATDEVYNYGSFKQSRMFAAGVTCSDCHEPHSAKLRAAGRRRLPAMPRTREVRGRRASATTRASIRRRPASPATCRRAPTWWSTRGTITASAFRGPICRRSSARPTPATTATPTSRRNGRRRRSRAGTGRTARASRHYAAAFHAAWTGGADAAALLAAVAADQATPGFARAGALAELAPSCRRRTSSSRETASPIPTRWCGSARSTCSRALPPDQALAARRRRCCPIPSAACASGRPRCSPPFRRRASRRPTASASSSAAAEFVAAQRLNADRPEARSTLGSFYARQRPDRGGRGRVQGGARARARSYAPAAINLADLYRQTGRDGDGEAALRAAIAASPQDAGLHHALGLALTRLKQAGRGARRARARRRARAGPRPLRLRLCGGAQFRRDAARRRWRC